MLNYREEHCVEIFNLPKFSGIENKLNFFIKWSEQYLLIFANENQIVKNHSYAVVTSKLTNRAEFSTSEGVLKSLLYSKFYDNIDLDVLICNLQFLTEKPHENLSAYIDEIIAMK